MVQSLPSGQHHPVPLGLSHSHSQLTDNLLLLLTGNSLANTVPAKWPALPSPSWTVSQSPCLSFVFRLLTTFCKRTVVNGKLMKANAKWCHVLSIIQSLFDQSYSDLASPASNVNYPHLSDFRIVEFYFADYHRWHKKLFCGIQLAEDDAKRRKVKGGWRFEDDPLEQEAQLCKYLLFPICINIGGGGREHVWVHSPE